MYCMYTVYCLGSNCWGGGGGGSSHLYIICRGFLLVQHGFSLPSGARLYRCPYNPKCFNSLQTAHVVRGTNHCGTGFYSQITVNWITPCHEQDQAQIRTLTPLGTAKVSRCLDFVGLSQYVIHIHMRIWDHNLMPSL